MTSETVLYITRHGQTMLNATERVQGWSDAPLTPEGRQGIRSLSKGLKEIPFTVAYSSDSGRAQETTRLILEKQPQGIHHYTDPRIREWSFGSFEGELESTWFQLMAERSGFKNAKELLALPLSYEEIAGAILDLDERNWAEPYEVIKERILTGMTAIAEKEAGEVLVVAHGLTIAHFLSLVSGEVVFPKLQNGSVSKVRYSAGKFDVISINDMSYLEQGNH
ncbi:histidine phosphatase family protein [uncultured Vagococcus sp.]|uniref:histidine phosphatase family protein n=1 Tax=uncultured Vagococcus sp. TaxID=189676 RepID=UPI0028D5E31F|nr:histidine phosphatase family protein [uncultured Vagococcus sp.]